MLKWFWDNEKSKVVNSNLQSYSIDEPCPHTRDFSHVRFSNDPKFRYVQFCALEENPACRLYDSWLDKYGGYKNVYEKAVKLKDGKFHNTVDYALYGERWDK